MKTKQLKILLINHEYPPLGGGGANACAHIARELAETGNHVDVITSSTGRLQVTKKGNLTVHRIPCFRRNKHHSNIFEMAMFILRGRTYAKKLAIKTEPDVIQSFFTLPAGVIGTYLKKILKKRNGAPLLIRLAGSDVPGFNPYRFRLLYPILRPIYRRIWQMADTLVVNSKGLKDLMKKSESSRNIKIITNGVDIKEFCSSITRRKSKDIICVARLERRKGIEYLIKAMPKLPKYTLTIAGAGPDRERLEAISSELATRNITFAGSVNHDKLPQLLSEHKVFVLPSLAEGMPNVVLEAMACGLPVVMTDVGGHHELIHGNGYVIRQKSPNQIASRISKILSDDLLRKKMGEKSKETAKKGFTWKKVADQYMSEYLKLQKER
ncbi:glycosyltransferase family 4 protein [Candidatus Woesearchaeota archaeon]|nr:glycosyltransferase family 4 protein [Candidatus Woesearchaeota archaeon]